MKRLILALVFCMIALLLAACGGTDAKNAQQSTESVPQQSADTAQAEPAITEASSLPDSAGISTKTISTEAEGAPVQAASASADRPVDLDLTAISGTVVYSQVYDMMAEPEAYMGQKIRMRGSLSYFQDPDTMQEYFAAIIADATACCAQGIEFVCKDERSYPQDYPPLDTEITVTGTFNTYYEGESMYIQLTDADMTW